MELRNDKYFPLLDVFRIFICLMVFVFHLVIHNILIIPQTSFLYPILSNGAIFMDAFFILSGFLLYYLYGKNFKYFNARDLKLFYFKRLIRIYPQYFIYTFFVILYEHYWNIIIIPAQILCIQAFFPDLFGKAGNGGTWFISCLVFSYLLFPILCNIVNYAKKTWLTGFLLYLFIIYILILSASFKMYSFNLYMNPIFRMLEFVVGMNLARFFSEHKYYFVNKYCRYIVLLCIATLCMFVFVLYGKYHFGNAYIYYSCVTIPIFSAIIYALLECKNKFIQYLSKNNFLKMLSGLTFPFYLWQGAAIRITKAHFLNTRYAAIYTLLLTLFFTIIAYYVLDKIVTKRLKLLLK